MKHLFIQNGHDVQRCAQVEDISIYLDIHWHLQKETVLHVVCRLSCRFVCIASPKVGNQAAKSVCKTPCMCVSGAAGAGQRDGHHHRRAG